MRSVQQYVSKFTTSFFLSLETLVLCCFAWLCAAYIATAYLALILVYMPVVIAILCLNLLRYVRDILCGTKKVTTESTVNDKCKSIFVETVNDQLDDYCADIDEPVC